LVASGCDHAARLVEDHGDDPFRSRRRALSRDLLPAEIHPRQGIRLDAAIHTDFTVSNPTPRLFAGAPAELGQRPMELNPLVRRVPVGSHSAPSPYTILAARRRTPSRPGAEVQNVRRDSMSVVSQALAGPR